MVRQVEPPAVVLDRLGQHLDRRDGQVGGVEEPREVGVEATGVAAEPVSSTVPGWVGQFRSDEPDVGDGVDLVDPGVGVADHEDPTAVGRPHQVLDLFPPLLGCRPAGGEMDVGDGESDGAEMGQEGEVAHAAEEGGGFEKIVAGQDGQVATMGARVGLQHVVGLDPRHLTGQLLEGDQRRGPLQDQVSYRRFGLGYRPVLGGFGRALEHGEIPTENVDGHRATIVAAALARLGGMSPVFTIDTVRIALHVLGVTVWLGGQIVLLALLPVLRSAGVEGLTAKAARTFGYVAWPAFVLTFFTGVWNLMAVNIAAATPSYQMVFGIKFLLVVASGVAAFGHAQVSSPGLKGALGGVGFLAALGAFVLGFVL